MTLVYHLQKVLYGLKQAFYIWYALVSKFLKGLEFIKTNANNKVFVSYNKSIFILVCIDDFLIINEDLNIINSLTNKLLKCFYITSLRLVFYYLAIFII